MSVEGSILAGAEALALEDGRQLRLLSAMEVLEARREAAWLARNDREQALCSNACLLARALEQEGQPLFRDGSDVLEQLTVEEISCLSKQWAAFNREVNPDVTADPQQIQQLKNVWSTRQRSGCTGACSEPSQPCLPRSVSER